jgi:hypothetical protein
LQAAGENGRVVGVAIDRDDEIAIAEHLQRRARRGRLLGFGKAEGGRSFARRDRDAAVAGVCFACTCTTGSVCLACPSTAAGVCFASASTGARCGADALTRDRRRGRRQARRGATAWRGFTTIGRRRQAFGIGDSSRTGDGHRGRHFRDRHKRRAIIGDARLGRAIRRITYGRRKAASNLRRHGRHQRTDGAGPLSLSLPCSAAVRRQSTATANANAAVEPCTGADGRQTAARARIARGPRAAA